MTKEFITDVTFSTMEDYVNSKTIKIWGFKGNGFGDFEKTIHNPSFEIINEYRNVLTQKIKLVENYVNDWLEKYITLEIINPFERETDYLYYIIKLYKKIKDTVLIPIFDRFGYENYLYDREYRNTIFKEKDKLVNLIIEFREKYNKELKEISKILMS